MVTFDELFLIVWDVLGQGVAVGETNEVFREFIKMLEWRCPGFHFNFYPEPWGELGIRKTRWERA